jgi:hypothetical protein
MFDYLYDDLIKHQWTARFYNPGGDETLIEICNKSPSRALALACFRVLEERGL